jgi:hypothetical protein
VAEEHHEPSGATPGTGAGGGWSKADSWAAGWYPDPWNASAQRYWSGESWTTQVYGADGIVRSHAIAGLPDPPVDPARTGGKTHGPEWIPPPWPQLATPTEYGEAPPPNRRSLTLAVVAALVATGLVIGFTVGFLATGGKSHADPPFSASPLTPAPTLPPATLPPATLPPSLTPGSTTPGSTTPGATTPGSTAPGSSPTQPADPDAATLDNLGLRQADATAGSTVTLIPMGDQVTGTTTLDVCNANYPSESLRRARRQVALVDPTLVTQLSSEAVLYRNPTAAAQGFAELKRAAAQCPPTPVNSPVGEPTVTTTFNSPPDTTWARVPGVTRLAFDFDTTDELGNTSNVIAVYLHKGRVLLALYFDNGPNVSEPIAGASTLPGIVRVFEQRLAAVPAAVANRH